MGVSDKVFHIKSAAEPERVMQVLREYADGTTSFEDFIGSLFVSSDSEDAGIYIGKIDSATYDYFVDYDENLVRAIISRDVQPADSSGLAKSESAKYGKIGKVMYDEKSKVLLLVSELMPGAESQNSKARSSRSGSAYTAKF